MSASATAYLRQFRNSRTVLARFVARRSLRGALLWGFIFGGFVASSAAGFAATYPTHAAQEKFAASFSNNVGLKALIGEPYQLATVNGFTSWRVLGALGIIGAIWGLLLATKSFRGEESAGRWELFLVGRTTARKAAANALLGLGAVLGMVYVIAAASTVLVGRAATVQFSVSASLFMALAMVASAGIFMVVGALASQLMPVRGRAAALAAGIFGIFYLLRAIGDSATSVHWLLAITPLGWIQKLRPLTGSDPVWLIPLGIFMIAMVAATLILAGRDLGSSVLADRDAAKPRTTLLRSPLTVAFRLTRGTNVAWIIAITFLATVFGTLAKTAGDAVNASSNAEQVVGKLAHTSENAAQLAGATTFMGVIFFIVMTLIMIYVATAVGAFRNDEAEGYLDNFLVRPVGRLQWLWGRVLIIIIAVVVAGLLAGVGAWAGAATQHTGIAFGKLLAAGINAAVPAAFALGVGVFAFGFAPRLASVAVYAVLAWSFLMEMIGSLIGLSHWILDTSVLHHVSLAPAAGVDWHNNAVLLAIAAVATLLGAWRFKRRDLASE